ncbi:MAG: hypothetical protein AB7F99_04210 [Vicinamibacterales bacterium]
MRRPPVELQPYVIDRVVKQRRWGAPDPQELQDSLPRLMSIRVGIVRVLGETRDRLSYLGGFGQNALLEIDARRG